MEVKGSFERIMAVSAAPAGVRARSAPPQELARMYIQNICVATHAMAYLEGVDCTVEQVKALLNGGIEAGKEAGLGQQDCLVVQATYDAQKMLADAIMEGCFTCDDTWAGLLNACASRAQNLAPGVFRGETQIGGGGCVRLLDGSFYQAPWKDVRYQLEQIIKDAVGAQDVLSSAVTLIARVMLLQPFFDGNKRVGILLANGLLMEAGHPPIIIPADCFRQYQKALHALFFSFDVAELAHIIYESGVM